MTLAVEHDVALAPLTTLELGGRAKYFIRATDPAAVIEALEWARAQGTSALFLGGGSNVVVGDGYLDALVIKMEQRGLSYEDSGDVVLMRAAAGEPWDPLVQESVSRGLAGLECLSGIPGSAGATPIQNVGAYGQEVSEVMCAVRAIDRRTLAEVDLFPDQCEFGYRDSMFKRHPDRYAVLGVTFSLRKGGTPTLRYAELAHSFGDDPTPELLAVRERVLELRRKKSMVLESTDPNRRSAGSFFTNPIVTNLEADRVVALAVAEGMAEAPEQVPRFVTRQGEVKLAAGWLIERAGVQKGYRLGSVGISSKHALALVHHGGGKTRELVHLARHIQGVVESRFGIRLVPEPTFWNVTL